jgi:hypothetical protein
MKTSNKIILSFFLFAWLALMGTLLISFKMSDQKGYWVVDKIETEVKELEEFSVVVIEEAGVLQIKNSDKNRFEYTYATGGDVKPPKNNPINEYQIRNDTLFIAHIQQASNGGFVLGVKDMKSISIKNSSEIEIVDFESDSLLVSSQNSKLKFTGSPSLDFLSLVSDDYFDLKFSELKGFGLTLRTNSLKLTGEIGPVSGKMGADSFLTIPQVVGKLAIDKPNTATISVE